MVINNIKIIYKNNIISEKTNLNVKKVEICSLNTGNLFTLFIALISDKIYLGSVITNDFKVNYMFRKLISKNIVLNYIFITEFTEINNDAYNYFSTYHDILYKQTILL